MFGHDKTLLQQIERLQTRIADLELQQMQLLDRLASEQHAWTSERERLLELLLAKRDPVTLREARRPPGVAATPIEAIRSAQPRPPRPSSFISSHGPVPVAPGPKGQQAAAAAIAALPTAEED